MLPPSASARAKFAAQLTGGRPPLAGGAGPRGQLKPTDRAGVQDATAPQRVLGARAQLFTGPRPGAAGPAPRPRPLVVTLPTGQLGVYTPQHSPFDPAGVFTRHLVWLPSGNAGFDSHHALLSPGHPGPVTSPRNFSIDWEKLWQQLLAALPKPTHGYVFYGDGAHATGSVPTHARSGTIVGYCDITFLLSAMDVANAEWKKPGGHVHEWVKQIAWVLRALNNVVATQDIRSKVKLDASDAAAKNGAQEACRRLKQAGWIPALFDSTTVARLPVRAVLPPAVTYSGRKVTMEEADMQAYQKRVGGETSGSSHYVQDANGDSVVVNKHYRGKVLSGTDTVKAR